MIAKFKPALRHVAAVALPIALAFISQPAAKALGAPSRTHIPFSFQVGNQQLPAGEYSLTRLFNGNVFSLKNVKTGKSVLVSVPASAGARPGQLIFKAGPNVRLFFSAR
jgi:hypothetical protein